MRTLAVFYRFNTNSAKWLLRQNALAVRRGWGFCNEFIGGFNCSGRRGSCTMARSIHRLADVTEHINLRSPHRHSSRCWLEAPAGSSTEKLAAASGRRRWPVCWCCLDRGPGSFDVENATTLSWSSAAVSEWVRLWGAEAIVSSPIHLLL